MEINNFELAVDVIKQAVSELLSPDDPENDEARDAVNRLLAKAEDAYALVQWPDWQNYDSEDWFEDEAIPSNDASYLIPIKRILES